MVIGGDDRWRFDREEADALLVSCGEWRVLIPTTLVWFLLGGTQLEAGGTLWRRS